MPPAAPPGRASALGGGGRSRGGCGLVVGPVRLPHRVVALREPRRRHPVKSGLSRWGCRAAVWCVRTGQGAGVGVGQTRRRDGEDEPRLRAGRAAAAGVVRAGAAAGGRAAGGGLAETGHGNGLLPLAHYIIRQLTHTPRPDPGPPARPRPARTHHRRPDLGPSGGRRPGRAGGAGPGHARPRDRSSWLRDSAPPHAGDADEIPQP